MPKKDNVISTTSLSARKAAITRLLCSDVHPISSCRYELTILAISMFHAHVILQYNNIREDGVSFVKYIKILQATQEAAPKPTDCREVDLLHICNETS